MTAKGTHFVSREATGETHVRLQQSLEQLTLNEKKEHNSMFANERKARRRDLSMEKEKTRRGKGRLHFRERLTHAQKYGKVHRKY